MNPFIIVNNKISTLEIEADDFAEMIIKLKCGIIASVHTDIYGRKHNKFLEIKGELGNIIWNFYDKSVTVYDSEKKESTVFNDFPSDFNQVYIEEINHFIDCCRNKINRISTLKDGVETMELIKSCEASELSGKVEKINS